MYFNRIIVSLRDHILKTEIRGMTFLYSNDDFLRAFNHAFEIEFDDGCKFWIDGRQVRMNINFK